MNRLEEVQAASNTYVESQSRRESNARTYARKFPMAIQEAHGIFLKDTDGRTYYDCLCGAGTLALGHNHPVVVEAIRSVLDSGLPLHTLDITTPVKEEFVDTVFDCLPKALANHARIQFCGPTGADAVEAAVKLVKTATGRRSMLSFHGGYHGMTSGALSLTGNLNAKVPISGLMSDVHFLPYPYTYRDPFGIGEEGHRIGSRFIEHVLNDPESGITPPAAMIMEAVQGEGGVIPAPVEWVRQMRRITDSLQIPLIIDEVQAGFGRTGKWFAFEHSGIIPDVVVMSKAIGGSLPLSVVIYHEKLDVWKPGAHAGTFRGNQMAMAAGTATLQYMRETNLIEHVREMGLRLMSAFNQLKKSSRYIGDVRGRGLMIGIEIVDTEAMPDDLGSFPAFQAMAARIQRACFERGLIVELGGRHGAVVRFLPPLNITPEQCDAVCTIFADAVKAAERDRSELES